MERQSIQAKIKRYITEQNLNQQLIARNMGISSAKLSRMLNGNRRMTVDDYEALCYAIAIEPARFFKTDNDIRNVTKSITETEDEEGESD